jgi:hypothetical protein
VPKKTDKLLDRIERELDAEVKRIIRENPWPPRPKKKRSGRRKV